MTSIPNYRFSAIFLAFTWSAFAQGDAVLFSSDLRAKYGPPLARETFAVSGIEMVVDYAVNGHVCRMQLPPVGLGREPGVKTAQAIDEFLLELIPVGIRGKELGHSVILSGLHSVSIVDYENISVAEGLQDRRRTEVTVTFKKEECLDKARQ